MTRRPHRQATAAASLPTHQKAGSLLRSALSAIPSASMTLPFEEQAWKHFNDIAHTQKCKASSGYRPDLLLLVLLLLGLLLLGLSVLLAP